MNANYFSIAINLWTSHAKHAYIALTVHYLDADFQLCCHMLEQENFKQNILVYKLHLTQETSSKSNEDNLIAATTDNSSNIVCALEHLGWNKIRYFAHVLQLAVLNSVDVHDVPRALAQCQNLVSHLNQSAKPVTNLFKRSKQT